jgi:hypothetical protein
MKTPGVGGSLVLQALIDMDFSVCCHEVFQPLFYAACHYWNLNDFRVLLGKIGPQIFSEFVNETPEGAKEKQEFSIKAWIKKEYPSFDEVHQN